MAPYAAQAAIIDLDFEGIAPYPNSSNVQILNYYNGGTSSVGTSGPNHGISFSSNSLVICLNSTTAPTPRAGLGANLSPRRPVFPLRHP
jgi:hypothetical protein